MWKIEHPESRIILLSSEIPAALCEKLKPTFSIFFQTINLDYIKHVKLQYSDSETSEMNE